MPDAAATIAELQDTLYRPFDAPARDRADQQRQNEIYTATGQSERIKPLPQERPQGQIPEARSNAGSGEVRTVDPNTLPEEEIARMLRLVSASVYDQMGPKNAGTQSVHPRVITALRSGNIQRALQVLAVVLHSLRLISPSESIVKVDTKFL
jgi:hypothetical protein